MAYIPRIHDPATDYAERVLSGDLVSGSLVKKACERHIRDLEHGHERGLIWRPEQGLPVERAFLGLFSHRRGRWADKPFVLLSWQKFIIYSLYGWFDKRKEERRFAELYLETAKGSGKSPLIACLADYRTFVNPEGPRAEAFVFATKSDQAAQCFDFASDMRNVDGLIGEGNKAWGVKAYGNSNEGKMIQWSTKAKFSRMSSGMTSAGKGISSITADTVIADEYHEHATSNNLDSFRLSQKDAKNALIIILTNAGDTETSPCAIERYNCISILNQTREDDEKLIYISSVDDDDDPFNDPSCWAKAHPSRQEADLPRKTYIIRQLKDSEGNPTLRNQVMRRIFGRWSAGLDCWVNEAAWNECEVKKKEDEPSEELLRKCPLYLGLDLSRIVDMTALAYTWILPGGKYFSKVRAMKPADMIKAHSAQDNIDYPYFIGQGDLETCPGDLIDFRVVAQWIADAAKNYRTMALCYDPHFAGDLKIPLEEMGISGNQNPDRVNVERGDLLLVPFSQTTTMKHADAFCHPTTSEVDKRYVIYTPGAIQEFEKCYLDKGKLRFRFNRLLRGAAFGSIIKTGQTDAHRKIEKRNSKVRIDTMIAFLGSLGAARILPKYYMPNAFREAYYAEDEMLREQEEKEREGSEEAA